MYIYFDRVNTVTFPPGNTAKLYFPACLRVKWGHKIKFWSMRCWTWWISFSTEGSKMSSTIQDQPPTWWLNNFRTSKSILGLWRSIHQTWSLHFCTPRWPSIDCEMNTSKWFGYSCMEWICTVKYYRNVIFFFLLTSSFCVAQQLQGNLLSDKPNTIWSDLIKLLI